MQPTCERFARVQELLAADTMSADIEAELEEHLKQCEYCQKKLDEKQRLVGPGSVIFAMGGVPARAAGAAHSAGGTRHPALEDPRRPGYLGCLHPEGRPNHKGYDIEEEVGRGAMGTVFKAHDAEMNCTIAVKIIAPELSTDQAAVSRFTWEAKAQAAVVHGNVVAIHAVESAKGYPFLVMEFIDGMSLKEKIEGKRDPLSPLEIRQIGMQIANALDAAHVHAVIHRDVKPANILLENGLGRVRLSDFGLARRMSSPSASQSGYLIGTPEYMSPEQTRGENATPRSDLFSLGVVLYEMATGQSPFRGDDFLEVLNRVQHESPKPVREINPRIPEPLARVIGKLLEKEPSKRYKTAEQVARDLGDPPPPPPPPPPPRRPRRHFQCGRCWSV